MRWFWIDRFLVLEKGKTARAVKNVSLAEEHLHDHFPGYPMMPRTLMIEGMAQTAGVLSGSVHDFGENVVLAKIQRATFYELVRPGDQVIYDAKLIDSSGEGHRAEIRATVGGKVVGEAEMMFANYRDPGSTEGDYERFVFGENFTVLLNMKEMMKQGGGDRGAA